MITDMASPASYASTDAVHAPKSLVNDPAPNYAMPLRATRQANRRPHDLITAVTSSYRRTQ
ncbi:hypothetical protein E1258_30955 [Micromonospora sp. KC207]|nr:hypothetical protein E1258_30955 [Micromonospora sp. KC207]